MELYQLMYFRAVAESQSMTEAAEKLHVSQPSLSRCIRSLEEELGSPVFDRVGRKLVLNSLGEVVLRQANITLDAASLIPKEVEAFRRNKDRTVNLYSPVPMGDDMRILMEFKKRHTDIRLRIGMHADDHLAGEAPDLTFFASPYAHEGPNYLKLGEEQILLYVPSSSRMATKDSVSLGQLDGADFVLNMPSSLRDIIDGMLSQVDCTPHIIMENQDIEQDMDFVGLGFGYLVGPSVTWWSSKREQVVRIPFDDVSRKRYLYLKWREGVPLSSAASALKEHLQVHYCRIAKHDPFFSL